MEYPMAPLPASAVAYQNWACVAYCYARERGDSTALHHQREAARISEAARDAYSLFVDGEAV